MSLYDEILRLSQQPDRDYADHMKAAAAQRDGMKRIDGEMHDAFERIEQAMIAGFASLSASVGALSEGLENSVEKTTAYHKTTKQLIDTVQRAVSERFASLEARVTRLEQAKPGG